MSPGLGHDPLPSYNITALGNTALCLWQQPQHILFQLANFCFALSYSAPSSRKGILFMHSVLIIGEFVLFVSRFMLLSGWAWHVICAPDIFSWNFSFLVLNIGQLVYIVYQMRPVRFDPELEEAYHTLFYPFKVSRLQFKRLVSPEFASIMSLHAGEAYAMQNLTRTDRLALLLSGKVNVLSDSNFLHPILPCEFLDSPEFESSRASVDDKFKVSIVAASSCRYLYWQRSALEYLLVKEAYLATVLTTLVARDIATKLYAMNNKILQFLLRKAFGEKKKKKTPRLVFLNFIDMQAFEYKTNYRHDRSVPDNATPTRDKGSHLDIRLPTISVGLTISGEYRSPRASRQALIRRKETSMSSDNGVPKDRQANNLSKKGAPNMEPLPEMPSYDDLASSGVEKYTYPVCLLNAIFSMLLYKHNCSISASLNNQVIKLTVNIIRNINMYAPEIIKPLLGRSCFCPSPCNKKKEKNVDLEIQRQNQFCGSQSDQYIHQMIQITNKVDNNTNRVRVLVIVTKLSIIQQYDRDLANKRFPDTRLTLLRVYTLKLCDIALSPPSPSLSVAEASPFIFLYEYTSVLSHRYKLYKVCIKVETVYILEARQNSLIHVTLYINKRFLAKWYTPLNSSLKILICTKTVPSVIFDKICSAPADLKVVFTPSTKIADKKTARLAPQLLSPVPTLGSE
ncbi:Blood vessel epicardial substance [Melipona quadrifasciata]|uniref:Blood vessel epicardial substance n=1 Tax=Melipona quadrifasciata TaxID=166423 RepID=A0A0M8ZXA3_9HYME|nr:Blood vessel epicardial substance [Melipona quadrifasciata]